MLTSNRSLPIPPHFNPETVQEVWPVPYQQRAEAAAVWAKQHNIQAAVHDSIQTCLLLIDVQNTFCIPGFELFVGGRSGVGAVKDNQRLCELIYRHLGSISQIIATLDTHTALQIFHPIFWINSQGEHPVPTATLIQFEQVQSGFWQVNPAIARTLGLNPKTLQRYAIHYTWQLSQAGKFPLTVWPYHSMLGGIGHALVSAVEEAIFFHTVARHSQAQFELKGNHPLTENYSVLQPEVLQDLDGQPVGTKNSQLVEKLLSFDQIWIAGQAKSHCVAWTIADLLNEMHAQDPTLVEKVYLLEDCTSPVVVPGVIDYTEQADTAFERFAAAGMHRVTVGESIIGG
ncbi:MAG: isochorismatase [Oscillatoriales cyanobacterium RM2_1_1]|nr:isochorismatase [Oscillatoriales cyanobacterium SM2_3_0]NJO45502.1 isochorismatase [Oscillatoriales cyanobacterium RM2_1_1]